MSSSSFSARARSLARALVVPLEVDDYENVLEGDQEQPEQIKRVHDKHEDREETPRESNEDNDRHSHPKALQAIFKTRGAPQGKGTRSLVHVTGIPGSERAHGADGDRGQDSWKARG